MSTLARRLVLGCLIPAALTPRSEWHERWKHVNAAAGALCGIAFNDSDAPNLQLIEDLIAETDMAFEMVCLELEGSGSDPDLMAAGKTSRVWEQRVELFSGLRKRVAERMALLLAQDVDAVEDVMAAIRESRK